MATQYATLAIVRAKSAGEKFACIPTNSAPGYSALAVVKFGPPRWSTSRFVKTPRRSGRPQMTPGAGNSGVVR